MTTLKRLWRNWRHGKRIDREVDDEVRATLDLLVYEKVESGMSLDEANRAARMEVGAVEAIKDNVRDVRAGAWLGPSVIAPLLGFNGLLIVSCRSAVVSCWPEGQHYVLRSFLAGLRPSTTYCGRFLLA